MTPFTVTASVAVPRRSAVSVPVAGSNAATSRRFAPSGSPMCTFGDPVQSALIGKPTGTCLVPWVTVAATAASCPGASVPGASSFSASVCARVCTETQSGPPSHGSRRASDCSPLDTLSTPTSDQPVNPPSSAGAAGFFLSCR